jgi:hypothetical protein
MATHETIEGVECVVFEGPRPTSYEPYRFIPLPTSLPTSSWFSPRRSAGATCQAQDDVDDAAGDSAYFLRPGQSASLSSRSDLRRYGSISRREAW